MKVVVSQVSTRDSNSWVQKASIEVELSVAGDSATPARAEDALRALDDAYRRVKSELKRLAKR